MKHIKPLVPLLEQERKEVTYTVVCTDPEGSLMKLIEYIKDNGNTGHSFSIVVDPGSDSEKTFGWDGDGGNRIDSVKRSD